MVEIFAESHVIPFHWVCSCVDWAEVAQSDPVIGAILILDHHFFQVHHSNVSGHRSMISQLAIGGHIWRIPNLTEYGNAWKCYCAAVPLKISA